MGGTQQKKKLKKKVVQREPWEQEDRASVLFFAFQVLCFTFTVIPVKPWTPDKISGMFIVSRPIRSEMKPHKITAKPQQGLITTWFETMS